MSQDKVHLSALCKFSVSSGKLETPFAELSFSKERGEVIIFSPHLQAETSMGPFGQDLSLSGHSVKTGQVLSWSFANVRYGHRSIKRKRTVSRRRDTYPQSFSSFTS